MVPAKLRTTEALLASIALLESTAPVVLIPMIQYLVSFQVFPVELVRRAPIVRLGRRIRFIVALENIRISMAHLRPVSVIPALLVHCVRLQ